MEQLETERNKLKERKRKKQNKQNRKKWIEVLKYGGLERSG